ncbi:MAG: hypothetical protein NTY64_24330 [Deltaproteobacteria bacterium]|nr:hypothetical protein [Deltaproteobacteria bacterium]
MGKKIFMGGKIMWIVVALFLSLWVGWLMGERTSSQAFGGNFAPQMAQQQGARYQIAGCDANSAWIIDTSLGDVFLFYSNGKWKEVGSILDEKKRIKGK